MTQTEMATRQRIKQILNRFGRRKRYLIPVLQSVQDRLGYIPPDTIPEIAQYLNIPAVDVYSVVTFYNQFRLHPLGRHSIRVCLGTACHMKGGYIALDAWKRRLSIDKGETTADGEFDLDTVACVGCCAMAPVTVVGDRPDAQVDPTKVDGILLRFKLEKEGKDSED